MICGVFTPANCCFHVFDVMQCRVKGQRDNCTNSLLIPAGMYSTSWKEIEIGVRDIFTERKSKNVYSLHYLFLLFWYEALRLISVVLTIKLH